MDTLLNVDDALEMILKRIKPLEDENIAIERALGRVLAGDIQADDDFPSFRSSSMDGFGVHVEDVQSAAQDQPVSLSVIATAQAGDRPLNAIKQGYAVRIMTGAPVPDGISAVIPIEDTDAEWDNDAKLVKFYKSAKIDENIRPTGETVRRGEKILSGGQVLRPMDIGMLALIGRGHVRVIKQPHVVVLSTGDELVRSGDQLEKGQIYDSNSPLLSALIREVGGSVTVIPMIKDTREAVQVAFEQAVALNPTLIISSGGVSVGALDYVRIILEEMGKVEFWRINLKPGKPTVFGSIENVPFFGLPGNPVSVWVTFDVLVRPALSKQSGKQDDMPVNQAILKKSVKSDGRRTYMRVKLSVENGLLYADSTGTQSSGALMSMVMADGLLIIPEGVRIAQAGDVFWIRLLRKIEGL